MGWAVEAVADYVDNIRPRFGCEDHPALWVTERGGRVKPGGDQRPVRRLPRRARAAENPVPRTSLRHSYVTHLTEDGVDRRFIQQAVGHAAIPRRPIYTHVSAATS